MIDEVVVVFRQGDVFGDDFQHAVVEVAGDVEQVNQVVLQFVVDKLFCMVFFHFAENLCHKPVVDMAGYLAEIFQRKIVGIAGGLVDAHFLADSCGNPGPDVFDHERDDDEVRDVLDNHADSLIELIEPVSFCADQIINIVDDFLLLRRLQFLENIGKGLLGELQCVLGFGHVKAY